MDILVSITVASYNNANYIKRCLDSVINQTYHNLEILIVDDGSQDKSFDVIENYKDDIRVRVISKENGGLSSVRQKALDEARGEFICFIDADDYLAPTYVESHLNNILKFGADINVCSTRFELENGEYLSNESKSFACEESQKAIKLEAELLNNGTYPLNITLSDSWNKMYKLSFLRETGVHFILPKGFNGTDTAFNWKLALYEPIYSTIKNEEYIHVIYNSSAVHRKRKKLYQGFKIITNQLIETAIRRDKLELYRNTIANFYYTYTRMAVSDLAREAENLSDCKMTVSDLVSEHKQFISKRNIVCPHLKSSDTDFNIIISLLNKKSWMLTYYLYFRTRIARIIN